MTTINIAAVEAAPPVAARQMRNAMVASVLGWSLDLFDLFILLYVAPVIGALFFRPAFRRCRWPPCMPLSR